MKKVTCEGDPFILLTPQEYEQLAKKAAPLKKITLQGLQCYVHFPLPSNRVSNWTESYNWIEHTGVVYKGLEIPYVQLRSLRELIREPEKRYTEFLKVTVTFDGLPVNITELEEILEFMDIFMATKPSRDSNTGYHAYPISIP
jgi:hypothetical protein